MENSIRRLRIIALLLFTIPSIALVGSLLIHNYLLLFKFSPGYNYNFKENLPGYQISILCNEENNYCANLELETFNKLHECIQYDKTDYYTYENGTIIEIINDEEIKNYDRKIFLKIELIDKLNSNCILNSKNLSYYNLFPSFYETVYKVKKNRKFNPGTSETVNPFIYGETSISNIVKRYPLNLFFKPLLYISVILMVSYWIYYNKILKSFTNSLKNFYFFNFGILSAIFLLLHVFFLGWTFESEFLTKLRRTFVVFFIFFEVLAQAFLIKKIFSIKDKMKRYLHSIIIYLKILFVLTICLFTISILIILMIYDLSSKIDYILEWNYFLVLLLFYYLSFLMWKKLKSNPATS